MAGGPAGSLATAQRPAADGTGVRPVRTTSTTARTPHPVPHGRPRPVTGAPPPTAPGRAAAPGPARASGPLTAQTLRRWWLTRRLHIDLLRICSAFGPA
ncbi:hypothetical protein GCM10010371_54950 [Streptomyces subrutilus]|uniref:Uncharacterized protein n=1 Tax=Streptomyces subrutilus TaxID=36818 RepID=A0A918R6R3_9ACTN|nr:hypothetical protein GCM10010371_54950 [Streptomyces subrutilus]